MKRVLAFAVAVACGLGLTNPKPSHAGDYGQYVVTYEIQVEYLFLGTDYSYWKTVYTTPDADYADWVYNRLQYYKELGLLNEAYPSGYWRYVAVDVRIHEKRTYIFPGESSSNRGTYSQTR